MDAWAEYLAYIRGQFIPAMQECARKMRLADVASSNAGEKARAAEVLAGASADRFDAAGVNAREVRAVICMEELEQEAAVN